MQRQKLPEVPRWNLSGLFLFHFTLCPCAGPGLGRPLVPIVLEHSREDRGFPRPGATPTALGD